jgi:FAD/FMN-containing dehydrogenase
VNDVGVPPERLAEAIPVIEGIFEHHGLDAFIYGHAGDGNLHLRPLFDLESPDLRATIRAVADEVYACVLGLGGTVTGEHGMGRLRAPFLTKEWGATLVGYMERVKRAFDPAGVLNPGVMFPLLDLGEALERYLVP